MSSLAAVQADGFYHPPDFDPQKHGSLNKYHGSHALRERASRISEGILVIRFEVPFHIWCSKCGEKIAKGERFNADKKAIGMYHTTKIWQFSMRHHCGCIITIQTDPKRAEYLVLEGAKKKVEDYSSADAEVIELMDDTEKERLALDPLYRLEQGEASRKRARTAAEDVADLLDDANAKHGDAYSVNARLRAQLRVVRKEEKDLDTKRKALNLPEDIRLLPMTDEDQATAALAFYQHDAGGGTARNEQVSRRQSIMNEPIFPPPERRHKQSVHTGPRLPPATAGPEHPQSVTSRERQVSNLVGSDGGVAAQQRPKKLHRSTTAVDKAGPTHGVKAADVPHGKDQLALVPGSTHGTDHDTQLIGTSVGVFARPTEQPGASKGVVLDTQLASTERGKGLKAAHAHAQATVAAWRASKGAVKAHQGGSKIGTSFGLGAKASGGGRTALHGKNLDGGGGGGRGGPKGMRAPAASTLTKAAALAQRSRVKGGVGFQVPEPSQAWKP